MKGANPQVPVVGRRESRETISHLSRGLIGEGDGDDLVRTRATRPEQVCDPVSENPGLSATSAGENQQRAITVFDGASLLGVQPIVRNTHSPTRAPL
jgi:hypothetical protein